VPAAQQAGGHGRAHLSETDETDVHMPFPANAE
jgi:hypothetical protein